MKTIRQAVRYDRGLCFASLVSLLLLLLLPQQQQPHHIRVHMSSPRASERASVEEREEEKNHQKGGALLNHWCLYAVWGFDLLARRPLRAHRRNLRRRRPWQGISAPAQHQASAWLWLAACIPSSQRLRNATAKGSAGSLTYDLTFKDRAADCTRVRCSCACAKQHVPAARRRSVGD